MSAAHVFRCEELATEIFNHLAPGPLRKTDTVQYRLCRRQRQTTLARAACVCRAWSDPALNVLWRVVDDIHNLLSLLPPYSVEEYLTAVFTRDIRPAEWERFQEYASRVRELHWRNPPTDPVDPRDKSMQGRRALIPASVWFILSRLCPRQGLCPRLQYLAALPISPDEPGPLIFVSPTIRHLELEVSLAGEGPADEYIIASLFSHMQPMLTSLESLTIGPSSDLDLLGAILSSPVDEVHILDLGDLRALRSLELGLTTTKLSTALITVLENMNLCSLALTIESLDEDVFLPAESRSPLRNSLRELHLSGDPYPLAQFVEYAAGTAMEVLSVTFQGLRRNPPNALYEVFQRIVGRISQDIIQISLTFSGDLDSQLTFLPAHDFLRHLVSKSHLEHIALIYDDVYGPFSRQALTDVVDAWPNLTVLRIEETCSSHRLNSTSQHDSAPDLEDLAQFAKHHPYLRHLVVPTLALYTLPATHQIPQLDHPLEILRVCLFVRYVGHQYNFFAVALLLDRLFPNLDLCRPQFQAMKTSAGKEQEWDQVERFLLALQAGRRGVHRD
ncbi:hypothetical protein C8Q70DRAFT_1121370 [Cubamyces menziesii]|nr:hypothetical protein C8Q70DRAFT_1121370 [Cubamyces menziesii]